MKAKARARLYLKLSNVKGNLDILATSMYGKRDRDAYKANREEAIQNLYRIMPLLSDDDSVQCHLLVKALTDCRDAPTMQSIIRRCKNFVAKVAQRL